jgi:mono/diheme cytochrome c family protein
VTEIPEHLLKRSRERRAASGAGGDDAAAATPAASAPAKVAGSDPAAASGPVERAAAPAVPGPPPSKPDSAVVVAYKKRRRIPFWAMVALSALPVWAFMYVRAVTQSPVEAAGPLGLGGELYGGCASCHGAGGGGGVGYAFTGGEVFKTFPNIEDQLRYVYFGTSDYNIAGVEIYGDPEREGGPHVAGVKGPMPAQGETAGGSLQDYEILSVVCHERYALGGADPAGEYSEEFEQWCSEESEIFVDLEAGGLLADLHERFDGLLPIGDAPAPGSSATE